MNSSILKWASASNLPLFFLGVPANLVVARNTEAHVPKQASYYSPERFVRTFRLGYSIAIKQTLTTPSKARVP